jgi:hypothetical protein
MASIISAGTTSATALNMSADTTGVLQLATNNGTVAVTVSTAQNVGFGSTPSAWGGGWRGLHLSASGQFGGTLSYNGGLTYLAYNAFHDGTNWLYGGADVATLFSQGGNGSFSWNRAGAGTAGNAISFSSLMTLNASGNLGVGETNPAAKLDVNGTAKATSYSSGLGGTTSSLTNGASETILTVANYSMYLVYGGGTSNTSAMGMALAQTNGGGTTTITQLSGAATGFTVSATGNNIQITNNTATQPYRWKAVQLINMNT